MASVTLQNLGINTPETYPARPLWAGIPVAGPLPAHGLIPSSAWPFILAQRVPPLRSVPPVQVAPVSWDSALPDGMHEIWRQMVDAPPLRHYGVAVREFGHTIIYELQKRGGPKPNSPEGFSQGFPVFVTESIPLGLRMEQARIRLNEAYVGMANYDIATNNCQHWASYVIRGKKISGQVLVGVMVAFGIGGLFILGGKGGVAGPATT